MNRLVARRLRGEDGASLIIAMAFVILFGIVLTALFQFAVTTLQSQAVINNATKASYAASAAVDTAVAHIRNDATMKVGGPGGPACGLTYHATDNAPDTTVTCNPVAGTDAVQPGVGGPANALLTLGAGGITASGAGSVKTTGNVFSNSAITLGGGAVLDAKDYAVTATGACSPAPNADPTASFSPWLAVSTQCSASGVPQAGDGADPHYTTRLSELLVSGALPAANPIPTCSNAKTVTFSPGYYTTADMFQKNWASSLPCGSAVAPVYWFQPGVYYFEFSTSCGSAPDPCVWTVPSGTTVIGGTAGGSSNWNAGKAPGTIAPDATTGPVNCTNSTTNGVQIILGGQSQIVLATGSKMELCPKVDANGFGIPLVTLAGSQAPPQPSQPTTVTLRPSLQLNGSNAAAIPANCSAAAGPDRAFDANNATYKPANALSTSPTVSPINQLAAAAGTSEVDAITASKTASMLLCGFDWIDSTTGLPQVAIPGNAVLNNVQVRVAHQENACDNEGAGSTDASCGLPDADADIPTAQIVTEVRARLVSTLAGFGTPCDSGAGGTPGAMPISQTIAAGTAYQFQCSGWVGKTTPASGPDFAQSLRSLYDVKTGATCTGGVDQTGCGTSNNQVLVQALLDGLEVVVTYTPSTSPPGPGSGCVTDATCPVLTASNAPLANNAPVLANWGTAYLPQASATLSFSKTTKIAFDRGLIAASVSLTNLPTADTVGRFRLGTGSGRTVELLATQNGKQKLRALMRIVDSATASPHGFAVAVREWSTAR